jgi:hypothetical protein
MINDPEVDDEEIGREYDVKKIFTRRRPAPEDIR